MIIRNTQNNYDTETGIKLIDLRLNFFEKNDKKIYFSKCIDFTYMSSGPLFVICGMLVILCAWCIYNDSSHEISTNTQQNNSSNLTVTFKI
jgi:hypothetical protein